MKLYDNGVLLLEFRVIGASPCSVDSLIAHVVNLFQKNVTALRLPASVFRLFMVGSLLNRRNGRWRNLRGKWELDRWLASETRIERPGDFDFSLVEVPKQVMAELALDFRGVSSVIEEAIQSAINGPLSDARYFVGGPRMREHRLGTSWAGRPNIYITTFEHQPDSASKIARKYKSALRRLMLRSTHDAPSYEQGSVRQRR